ncbi:MAG: DUF465 domain-containing protein [Syntrophales bacterium]|nr:DUF465 domain-containing protein [Syntrophales bacterium]MDD5233597.1 DUF465 domain-containing protein [Syntrophales bacterium]MDD5531694.1 DUF465 domain-containing protein [Syntrophales bacterium]HPL62768.1 hypothetical protein [Syntrophales bacterium]
MEKVEELLIARYINQDEELKKHWEEHQRYEKVLEDFNKRVYLTPQEEIEKKKIQKMKLAGKDRIHEILSRYRDLESKNN